MTIEDKRKKIQDEKYHGLMVDVSKNLKKSVVTVSNQCSPGYKVTKSTKPIVNEALRLIEEFNEA